MRFYEYDTLLGRITIAENAGRIVRISPAFDAARLQGERSETALIREAFRQLDDYFDGKLFEFSLPLAPQGTDFMQSVWRALREIPYGQTVSYKDIAVKIGNPKAVRAVGMANHRNPIAIVIPCHRVIGSGGIRVKAPGNTDGIQIKAPGYTDSQLVGYRSGLENKRKLLELEARNVLCSPEVPERENPSGTG